MFQNDRKVSNLVKAIMGTQHDLGKRDLRPRCVLCGKARSGRHRGDGALAKICSRPGCDSYLKNILPNEQLLEKLVVLEVHHYFHEQCGSNIDLLQPTVAEAPGDSAAEKRAEMPDHRPRRVTRAMTRQSAINHDEGPPLYRRFNKPTLIL